MNTFWVRAGVVALMSSLAVVSCDDNPVDEGRGDPVTLIVNPGFAVVDAADTTQVNANALDEFGDLTLGQVQFSACDNKIAIAEDPSRVALEPPDRVIVIGQTLGESCVVASGPGGLTDTSTVAIVAADLVVTSAPDTLRAGQTSEVVVTTVASDGSPVGPFTRSDASYASDDSDVVAVTDDIGSISTSEAGAAEITASWTGLAEITRTAPHTVTVIPNVPVGAALASESFGGVGVADSTKLEVSVSDAEGNQNINASEITSITAQSSDPSVATVRADRDVSADGEEVTLTVAVFGVASGTASITGTVSTTEGDFDFGPSDVTVLNPVINSISPMTGSFGTTVTISGSSFVATGFETLVLVDGEALGNMTVTSSTQISAVMPTFADGAYDVEVSVGGVLSDPVTWTQAGEFDEASSEPANDVPGTAPTISMPFDLEGSTGGTDIEDMFAFTLSDSATLELTLDWDTDNDFDVTVMPAADAIPFDPATFANYGVDVCGNTSATGNKPEEGVCEDLEPGDYILHIIDFDGGAGDDDAVKNWTVIGKISQ